MLPLAFSLCAFTDVDELVFFLSIDMKWGKIYYFQIKAKLLAWHPEVATQLCLSSEDDHTPVIQLWDLRYATSPLKVLENHQKYVFVQFLCKALILVEVTLKN